MNQSISIFNRGKVLSSVLIFVGLVIVTACKSLTNVEAIDDANAFKEAKNLQLKIENTVSADVETTPVNADSPDGDSADDPAIWYNEAYPEQSVVFGSNKQFGIHAYDLKGRDLQFVNYAQINNIDVRQTINFGTQKVDVLAGSNRTQQSVDIFLINANGKIAIKPDYQIHLGAMKPYGLCLYKDIQNNLNIFVNDKEGNVLQIIVKWNVDGGIQSEVVRKLKLDSQVEGMVVDDVNHKLYVGEEMAGIHVFEAAANADSRGFMLPQSSKSNSQIKYDVEGLALLPPHYLIASSQGNFSYAIFDLKEQKYVTSFIINENQIDGVEETDGLEVFYGKLGTQFPKGIFVVQDGFNFQGNVKQNQNFKIVDLNKILPFLN